MSYWSPLPTFHRVQKWAETSRLPPSDRRPHRLKRSVGFDASRPPRPGASGEHRPAQFHVQEIRAGCPVSQPPAPGRESGLLVGALVGLRIPPAERTATEGREVVYRSGEGQPIASTGLYAILFPAARARFHDGSGVDAPCGPQNGRGAGGPERAIGYPEGKAYQKFQR